ncbi:hypothetical protein AAFF_G00214050 [Aldrovandia affinis]|uniref:Uncharacterized protein n=1 Tax=Aldrovandia affinis TaxID=143900 RepID=A0AAD7W583_9TELE|nr:hypothetical protein AAFF_G00214050 [Aldrovandia affinis]
MHGDELSKIGRGGFDLGVNNSIISAFRRQRLSEGGLLSPHEKGEETLRISARPPRVCPRVHMATGSHRSPRACRVSALVNDGPPPDPSSNEPATRGARRALSTPDSSLRGAITLRRRANGALPSEEILQDTRMALNAANMV